MSILCFTRLTLILFCIWSIPDHARADRLQLSNGDEIAGKLIEMSEQKVKFRHPILGELTVDREEIHAIELGDQRGGERIMADGTKAAPETPEEVIDRLVNPEMNARKVKELAKKSQQHAGVEGAVEELRRQGVDSNMMMQLHGMLPGFGSPEVQEHFTDRVTGLMSGSLSVDDIRDEAIDARDQLKELMDELGPNGAALQGYYGILDSFIKKSDPNAPLTPSTIPPIEPLPQSIEK